MLNLSLIALLCWYFQGTADCFQKNNKWKAKKDNLLQEFTFLRYCKMLSSDICFHEVLLILSPKNATEMVWVKASLVTCCSVRWMPFERWEASDVARYSCLNYYTAIYIPMFPHCWFHFLQNKLNLGMERSQWIPHSWKRKEKKCLTIWEYVTKIFEFLGLLYTSPSSTLHFLYWSN